MSYAPTLTERLSIFLSKIKNLIIREDSHKEDSEEIKNGGVSKSSSALVNPKGETKGNSGIPGINQIRKNDPKQISTEKSSEKITK